MFSIIKKINKTKCRALSSMPKVYQFRRNIIAIQLIRLLKRYEYTIQHQVINYRNKVIGIIVKDNIGEKVAFLPCMPSSIVDDIPVKFMDDVEWKPYEYTRELLYSIHDTSEKAILCLPKLKVVEQGLIVGILTETNQFIQIDPPITDDIPDDLESINVKGYANKEVLNIDKTLAISEEVDTKRIRMTRNISLETQFYYAFRTLLRIALNDYKNRHIRTKIIEKIRDLNDYHINKLYMIESYVRQLIDKNVSFTDIPDDILDTLNDISICNNMGQDDSKPYCLYNQEQNDYVLLLPRLNLINQTNNESYYFKRLTDEIIRYKRIQSFLLEPAKYLNITNVDYKIHTDEFILLQSSIDDNYLDNLTPFKTNPYVKNITYDIAEPTKSQTYTRVVTLEEQRNFKYDTDDSNTNIYVMDCIKETLKEVIGNVTSFWRRVFPVGTKELVFTNNVQCGYTLMIDIIYRHLKQSFTIESVKFALSKKYSEYIPQHLNKIINILSAQGGKKKMMERVKTNRIRLTDLVITEEYYLTNLDIWMLASMFDLPIVLFSIRNIQNLFVDLNWIVMGGDVDTDNYYFIRTSVEKNIITEYHLISPSYKMSALNGFQELLTNPVNQANSMNIGDYLANVKVPIGK
jgi:hypothetical protein